MATSLFKRNNTSSRSEMSFIDHLEALRWHLMRSVIAILAGAIVIFFNIDFVFDKIIFGPIRTDFVSYTKLCDFSHWLGIGDALCLPPANVKLQALAFGTQFMSSITVAIFGGFIIAFPYIFWEIWRFVRPALTQKEVKSTRGAIAFVTFFFFAGIAFGYFLLAPFTFSFLANYKLGVEGILQTMPSMDDYIENLVNILIGCGLAFQLPVAAFIFTKIGLITPNFLRNSRKFALVIILVVAAIITPSPDWMSQLIVTLPLWLLYEFSIYISARVAKEQVRKDAEWS